MKLAVLQDRAAVGDVPANLSTLTAAMARAAARGADALVTPELFLTGYAPGPVRAQADLQEVEQARRELASAAAEHRIAVVISYPAAASDGTWQIRACLYDREGRELLDYGKVHLFGPDEAAAFSPDQQAPTVVDLAGIPVSIVICYDVEFPETVRAAAVAGAELILVPTAMSEGYREVSEVLLRARALENHAVLAYSNHAGEEDGILFDGRSVIAGPRGRDLARAGEQPELILAEIDREDLQRSRREIPYLQQRRPELYARWER